LEGWVAHELGADALLRGRFDDARGHLQRAFDLRRDGDPGPLARTRDVLETLRLVSSPPPPWWRASGSRGPLIATIAGIAVIGAVLWISGVAEALQGVIFGPAPTESPTAAISPSPTAEPASPSSSPSPSTMALSVEVGPLTDAIVDRNGDWTGRVAITPLG